MEQIFSSFQDGLDTRRSILTTSVHALQTAVNVHINQGAEVEKRRAFVDFGATAATEFGLELTDAGLVNFGSAAVGIEPSGVAYQRLQHPSDVTKSMTAVLCSCSFGGKAWVVAQFSNGDVFIYYNGAVISATTNGLVLTGAATNLAVATQFYNYVNSAYYNSLGLFASAPVLIGTSYYVDIYSTPGVSFSLVPSIVTSAAGTIGTLLISSQSQGTAFSQANFAFAVYMGKTGTISSVLVSTDNGATYGVSLLGAAVGWAPSDTTGYATALNIAATVSSSLTSLPITAQANNNQIVLLADTTLGATPNGYPVKLTTTGDFCLDDMVLDMTAVATGALTSSSLLVGSLTTVFKNQTYSGGGAYVQSTPAGTYFWHKGANDVSMAVAGGSTFFADNFFTIGSTTNVTFTGVASAAVTAQLTKMVEILGATITGTTAAIFVTNLAAQVRIFCTANSLSYTACASTANLNQLVVSRNVILSLNQFYPILASDVVGVAGIAGQVVQTNIIIKGAYIPIVTQLGVAKGVISGVVNVSIIGGSSPYFVTYTTNLSGTALLNNTLSFNLPDGNPSAVTGSFAATLSSSGITNGQTTVQYTITIQDATGNVKTLIMTVAATVDGSQKLTGLTVTFL